MVQTIFIIAMVSIVVVMLVSVPALSITIPVGIADTLISVCSMAGYLLPIKLLMPIILFELSFHTFRFVWAVFLRVKSFIPMGG